MKYKNPIITGFHPDPSICRVGEDYYIINSTFEYFPGIPVFHSRDLINWTQIGYGITRSSQMTLMHGAPNLAGIYAPTIRYSNGVFCIISTNVAYDNRPDSGNFIIHTTDPYGEWSEPVWLDCPGIDSSLFFDDDGKVYYTGAADDSIYLCELDLKKGCRVSERTVLWKGTGGSAPEGPHLYKINGWYYLFISEGGTEYCHMLTVARSKNIEGPYEECPRNPVLTNRSLGLELKAIGHADLVEDHKGNWWAVCLGIRPVAYPWKHNLGRETMLVPVKWDEEGWPIMGKNGSVEEIIETDQYIVDGNYTLGQKPTHIRDDFSDSKLNLQWNYIYNPVEGLCEYGEDCGGLILHGNAAALSSTDSVAWLGRRQEHISCLARTLLEFNPILEGEEAGLTIYMNNRHHYEVAVSLVDGRKVLIFRRQIGSLFKVENTVLLNSNQVYLEIEADKDNYIFKYSTDGADYTEIGRGETAYLTTEVGGFFTGNYFGMYAYGNGRECSDKATFKWFEYEEK